MYQLDASQYLASKGLTPDAFRAEMAAQSDFWFHTFDFTNGVSNAGRDPSAKKLGAIAMPERLDGLSVLDIGACDGYFSFQAEARGAARVVASDHYLWTAPNSPFYGNFRYMRTILGSNVEELIIPVEEISPERVGQFDVVLFLGVLYHAPNMIAYLQRVRSVTRRMAIVETLVDLLDVPVPAAAFYPPESVNADSSNFWGPNTACVEHMLKRTGFSNTTFVSLWELNTLLMQQGKSPYDGRVRSGRGVWHAFV